MNIEINAGDEEKKLIEVKNPNSLLYIGFKLIYYDINFHLIKYCPNLNFSLMSNEKEKIKNIVQYEEQKYFYEIFKIEKSKGAKIIIFIKNPGIYKIIFDNKYSWFNSKFIKYRCSILNELNNLNLSQSNSSDKNKLEKKESADDINNINNNDNIKLDVKVNDNSESNKSNEQDVKIDEEN